LKLQLFNVGQTKPIMLRILSPRILFITLLLVSFSLVAQDPYRAGVIHVKLKDNYAEQVRHTSVNTLGIAEIDQVSNQVGITYVKRLFRESGSYEKAHRQFDLHLWYEIKFDERKSLADVIRQYNALGHFQLVEPCLKYELVTPSQNSRGTPPAVNSTLPLPTDDPLFSQQWHYNNTGQSGGTAGADISLPQAWAMQAGDIKVVVAVIDGGIDIAHPDLGGAMWINTDEIAGNNIDDDNNGYVDDVNGYGFGDNTGTIYPHFHGTHVGGTIGAVTNNGIGVSGIAGGSGSANGVRLMSCAGFGQYGTGGFEDAMVYAADNGAVISQNSWGGGSTAIEDAIDYFVARAGYDNSDANFDSNIQTGPMAGGIVIFAAGNSNTDDPNNGYPGSYPAVMAVASTDHNDVRSYFSNYGSWVDIAAPGSEVFSTYPVSMGSYAYLSGTSMACPHVSGVAALIIAQFGGPSFFSQLVWDRLQETADDISPVNPGYEDKLGAGRVNAFQSLQVADEIPPADITDLFIEQTKLTSVVLQWTATGASGMDGSASAYEIRYSTAPITIGNFSSATLVTNVPRPKVSGSEEQFEIKNLTHSTIYYFAMRSRDFFGNLSGLSNIVSAATLLPPVIEVSPTSLTEDLFSGGTSSQNIVVKNTGASDLIIGVSASSSANSTSSVKNTAREIQLVYSPSSNAKKKAGNEYRNRISTQSANQSRQTTQSARAASELLGTGRLFTLNINAGVITELNPTNGDQIRSFAPPESYYGGPEGLAFDGEYLYFVSGFGSNSIYRLNPETGAVISTLSTSLPAIDALGHSGEFLYAMDYASDVIREIDFDSGTITRTISPGIDIGAGLSFGGSRGTLFAANFSNQVYEIELESGNIINSFNTSGVNYGLGYSEGLGLLLCANINSSTIEAYDPETGEQEFSYSIPVTSAIASDESGNSWLSLGNDEFTVAPGQEMSIPVLFDATGLNGGSYEGDVSISSNDPVTPLVVVPVTLHVTGAPNLSMELSPINFGDRYTTGSYDTAILISNNGTDVLNISSITISNAVFVIDGSTSFSIEAGGSTEVHLVFTPVSLGMYEGLLTINSNDPDQSTIEINVTGRAVAPPVIDVNPESFEVSLFTGESLTQNLEVQNIGEADLRFNIQIETQPIPGNASLSYLPARSEIITANNSGEKLKSFVFNDVKPLDEGDFTSRASSPNYLTAFTSDPTTGFIYAQQNGGYNFYKYVPASDAWTTLAACPLNSGNNGGAAYLDGKIYTSYTGDAYHLGVYTISSNTWSTVTLETYVPTGNIESDGTYIYLVSGSTLVRYNPQLNNTTILASPPFTFNLWGGLSYLNGELYGHQGDGWTGFAKFNIANNTWTTLPSVPGGAVLGSAIDPSAKVYYAYGSYGGNSWYAYDIESGTWSVSAIPLFFVGDGGLAYVPTSGASGIYFAQGENGIGMGRFETSGFSNWLAATPTSGTLEQNDNQSIQVIFDATDLFGGTYHGTIHVGSNDPVQPQIEIPVTLHVTGAPNISVERDLINFDEVFINQIKEDSLLIENTGTDMLTISSISTALPFGLLFSPFELAPGTSRQIRISFSPTSAGLFDGVLVIANNDPGEASINIPLRGNSVPAPVVGVNPTSLSASLLTGQQQTKTLTISNTGGSALHWNMSIENAGSNSLNDILESLNDRFTEVTSVIPSRFDFYEGESGYSIGDGGNDMYDVGNILGTNLGSSLNYTQGVISSNSILGAGGIYFTKKYPGLFVMAADINASNFEITGDLGADGSGSVDGAVLQATINGKNYKGFVKRVYNAGDPSVNHLIIVEDNGTVGHDYSTYTNSDYHRITGLAGLVRVYYLLFAGNSGAFISNSSMQGIMTSFLSASDVGINWLTTDKTIGTIAVGQSEIVNVTFNATGLDGGVYTTTLNIGSNDPVAPVKNVPITLAVTGAPDIALSKTSLNFQNVYVGGTKEMFFNIRNSGSAVLSVSSISVSNATFTVSPSSLQLNPRDSVRVYLHFNPTEVGAKSAIVRILSNDVDESDITVSLVGNGITAPAVTITPDNINVSIMSGDRKYVKIRLRNTGGDRLDWYLDNYQSPYWSTVDYGWGNIFPDNEAEITFTIDSRNISSSTYNWQMWIYTNDPLRQQIPIPFQVTIAQNHAPTISQVLQDMQMGEDLPEIEVNLADYFTDPDQEVLKFYAQCDATSIVSTEISGSVLTITSHQIGSSNVSVIAEDGLGEIALQSFEVTVGSITDVENLIEISKLQSYPNPFEGRAQIKFSLQKVSTVNLRLYDVAGKERNLLQSKGMDTGDHIIEIGEDLNPGIYVCRLTVDGLPAGAIKIMKK
jgi:subtilisin family serine protease